MELRFLVRAAMILGTVLHAPSDARPQDQSSSSDVVLAAVSRDRSMLTGGIEGSSLTSEGTAQVEPIARLSPDGTLTHLPCERNIVKDCAHFQRDYLSKTRTYTLVSSNGRSVTVSATPAQLDECYDYAGSATYSSVLPEAGIAASSPEQFATAPQMKPLDEAAISRIERLIAQATGAKPSASHELRGWSFTIAGSRFVTVQGKSLHSADAHDGFSIVFAVALEDGDDLRVQFWGDDTGDQVERVLGTFKLKSGPEFLVTAVNDPEGHWYRFYGWKNDRLRRLYEGGGSSC